MRQTGYGGVRPHARLHWLEERGLLHCSALNNLFGSETKQAKTANAVQTRKRKESEKEKKKSH